MKTVNANDLPDLEYAPPIDDDDDSMVLDPVDQGTNVAVAMDLIDQGANGGTAGADVRVGQGQDGDNAFYEAFHAEADVAEDHGDPSVQDNAEEEHADPDVPPEPPTGAVPLIATDISRRSGVYADT